MTSAEWIDMLRAIPEVEHGKLVIVLLSGTEICIDTIARYDEHFLIARGRQGGTIEEARGFIVPYSQFVCLRLDRTIKVEELQEFFGTTAPAAGPVHERETTILTPSANPTPTAPADPAAASRMLLERIRAVRASSASRYTP